MCYTFWKNGPYLKLNNLSGFSEIKVANVRIKKQKQVMEEKLKWEVTSPENKFVGGWLTYTIGVVLIILIYGFITTVRKLFFSNSRSAPAPPPRRNKTSASSSSQLGFVFWLYVYFYFVKNSSTQLLFFLCNQESH